MNGICCDVTGKRVGVLAYAPWSSERLEFNQRDRLMYASWEQLIPLLVFPQSFYLSHSPFFFLTLLAPLLTPPHPFKRKLS